MNITAKNILTVGDGRYKIAPNLYLVVRRNGLSRSFVFRYTFDGKRKDLSLGDPAIIKIQMAKDEALKCHTLLTQGVDPKAFREEKKARECQDFCVWGGYSRGSPTRLPFVFCDAVCQT